MTLFSTWGTTMVITMIVVYVMVISVANIRLRSRISEQLMVTSRSMPTVVVTVLLMSGYIGAKLTISTSQGAFSMGVAAPWSIISATVGFLLFDLFVARCLYASGQFTISGFIAKKCGNLTKLVMSAIMIYTLFPMDVGSYVSGAAAISTVMHVDLSAAALITTAISTTYFVWGGLKSVAYLTIMHSAVKMIDIGIIVAVA